MIKITERDVWQHLDQLTKPPRSLGQLEKLAARLCMIQQTLSPITKPRRLVLFVADHGVVAEGVSAWPAEVTGLMIDNIRQGGAASSVLAGETGTELRLIDVGACSGGLELNNEREISVRSLLPGTGPSGASHKRDLTLIYRTMLNGPADGIVYRKQRIRAGSRNLHLEPALSDGEFEQALQIGREEAILAQRDVMSVVACGEMGIGNTSSAACLTMLLADVPLTEAVGRGAGADDQVLRTKGQVVGAAVKRARGSYAVSSRQAIASVAGLEIVAMAGFFVAAHEAGLTIVLDGYVTTAAALIAQSLAPGCVQSMIASHLSAEPGHRGALQKLGLSPFLTWDLRLGEGTGALLLLPLLDAAAAMCGRMRTLAEMGIAPEAPR